MHTVVDSWTSKKAKAVVFNGQWSLQEMNSIAEKEFGDTASLILAFVDEYNGLHGMVLSTKEAHESYQAYRRLCASRDHHGM
jgi:hypothetical protein